jgi:cholesterol oxidase
MEQIFDFIIVGSGFGGSISAMRLAEKGYSVCIIEKGKRFRNEDFPKTNNNLFKYLWVPALRMFGIQKLTFYKDASILSGVGVGGGSLVYANTLFYPPDDFFEAEEWSGFADWKKKLKPFYDKADFMLGRTTYHKINTEDKYLQEVSTDYNSRHTFTNVNVGVYLDDTEDEKDPYFSGLGPIRKACKECAGCMVGCRENSKNTLDKNYLYFAEKFGARIIPETIVDKIHRKDGFYQIETRSSTSFLRSEKQVFTSKGIIISGGTLGSMELLLKQKYKYKTLPDLSDYLGSNVRTNSETLCAVSGAKEKLNNGLAITSVFNPDPHTHIEIVKYPDGSNAMKSFFGLAVKGSPQPLFRTLKLFGKTILQPHKFLKILFDFNWSSNMVVFLVMQSYNNRMKLIWKKTWRRSSMKIKNEGNLKVPAYIDIGQKVMESYARKTGGTAQNNLLEVFFNRPTTAHILGGSPMGKTKEEGLINEHFEVHGYPGMYVLDGSVLQANPGVNPSFSISALAEYAMSHIPEKKGNQNIKLEQQIEFLKNQLS